jgi:hypothetical protein
VVSGSTVLAVCSWLLIVLLATACYRSWQVPAAREGGRWKPRITPSPAERRARALLREMLSDAEYEQWKRCGYVEVRSPTRAHRVYRIPGTGGRVRVYERGVTAMELCLQPIDPLPPSDLVLLHKLLIESDEQDYLATANQFAVGRVFGILRAD